MKGLLVLLAIATAAVAAEPGHPIYVSGTGKSPITAMVGGSELPGTLVPCANCHGAAGRGNAEGGVTASNITWLELTKPYRAETPNGRRRPAYNEQTLRRAITEGVDSAGNPLLAAMPRYAMAPDDLTALVAYLKVLGRESVPGVTDTSVRVGTIVPDNEAGAQMAAVLSAYFKEAGVIHGRRLELDVVTPASLEKDPPFALAGGLIVGSDALVEEAVERAGVPLVLPVSLRSDVSAGNRQRFYLTPGVEAQLRGLLRFANVTKAVVVTKDEQLAAAARRLGDITISASVPADDAAPIVFLDPDAKLASVPLQGKSPLLFLGNLLPDDFFEKGATYGGRIRVALTTTPGDVTAGGVAEYRAFAARHAISGTQVAAQLSAYAAAKAFVHALKQSGRELTRDSLRTSLESLYEFQTGVTPPLTFGRSRRIAAPRVHVASIDPKSGALIPAGTFHIDD